MERAEAEAIYDSGREACVEFMLELAQRSRELRKNSRNSSKPPSSDPPKTRHQVDEIVDHFPESCGRCGHGFGKSERRPSSRFGRHQVAELPPIAVTLTEHRTHRLRCPECKAKTTAELPDRLGDSAFGPAPRLRR